MDGAMKNLNLPALVLRLRLALMALGPVVCAACVVIGRAAEADHVEIRGQQRTQRGKRVGADRIDGINIQGPRQ